MKNSLISEQNPWWKSPEGWVDFDKHLKPDPARFITFTRQDINLEAGNIYLILGPRQVGKTFWIKQHIKALLSREKLFASPRSVCYLSCDTLTGRSRKELRTAIDFLIEGDRQAECTYLFLDEITYINDWAYTLKELADSGQTRRLVVVATGSSPAALKEQSETLPGRGLQQHLIKPLTFREFILQATPRIVMYAIEESLRAYLRELISKMVAPVSLNDIAAFMEKTNQMLPFKKELDYLFNFYLLTGGYPFVINHYFNNHFNEKKGVIADAVYREAMQTVLSDLKNLGYQEDIIRQVLFSIINKMGNRYSYTDLSQSGEGLTRQTLVSYVSHLERSFILNPLLAYDFNKQQPKYKGDKKIYFTDPFVLASAQTWLTGKTGYDISDDLRLNQAGYLVETIVAQHLAVANESPVMREVDTFCWFYYNAREIDFVYRTKENDFLGIEATYQESPRPSDVARVSQIKKYLLLTKDEYDCAQKDPNLPASRRLRNISC